jgi:hypothetical protein
MAAVLLMNPARADEFFEKKIRPVLAEHCYKCHSAEAQKNKKLKGGLRLDTREMVLTGGDSGPALVAKKPAESLLLKTMKYEGDTKMPPAGKLPAAVIADFEKWIADGANGLPSGTGGVHKQIGMSIEEGRKFWAYLPVNRDTKANGPTTIDEFILAKLTEKGLKPAAPADKSTLIRRLYFDLIGLPPTPAEVDAFLANSSAEAYEKIVDQLLASPQFGERWGRHWLDVVRYADSVTLRGFVYKQAWRYRDYVIDSFNADVPFDRFIREQLAGDLLSADSLPDRQRNLTATTFLQLGNTNLEEQDKKQLRMDVVDEQLDVITKGFLAQTVTCARCHDHKFDPIPAADYYALAGILRNVKAMEHANVSNWVEVSLPLPADEEEKHLRHEAAVAALQVKIKAAKGPTAAAKGVLAVKDVPGVVVDDAAAKKVGEWQHSTHSGTYIGEGYTHDQDKGKGEKTLTFQPETIPPGRYEVWLAYSSGTSRAGNTPVTVFSADGEKTVPVDMKKTPPIDGRFVSLGEFRFEKNGQCYVIVSNEGTKGHVTADAIVFVSLDQPATADKKADVKSNTDIVKALEADLKKLQDTSPKRPKVMSVIEEKLIEDTRVHIRGSVHTLGDNTPRGFLRVATVGPMPKFPADQSGRKELADWIASADNPLTARVFVNRAWHWLFGSGIVRTVDNFGTTGETPSHPELLDYLAAQFMANPDREGGGMGWSVKKLVRRIVLSRTYQQSTTGDAPADPDNKLFGRANRRRLEAECIRDGMLMVSGKLDLTRGGPTFPETLAADYGYHADSLRRSVYLPMFRNAMPESLEVFDAADPSSVTGKRNTSTVAQQALYLMNHPFPKEQAKHAAAKLLGEKRTDNDARITHAYRLTLGREPTAGERTTAAKFLNASDDPTAAWATLFHALFATPDFRYVD